MVNSSNQQRILDQIRQREIDIIRHVARKCLWLGRIGVHLRKSMDYCDSCQQQHNCIRIFSNELIIAHVLKGKQCYDYKPVWDKLWSNRR